jgi:hypothetical protein
MNFSLVWVYHLFDMLLLTFRNNNISKCLSVNWSLLGVKISPPWLKSLSTAADDGSVTLYRLKNKKKCYMYFLYYHINKKEIVIDDTYLYIFMIVGKFFKSSKVLHICK